jgi:hypothetical protein
MRSLAVVFFLCIVTAVRLGSQEHQHAAATPPVPLQPMAQQARQLTEALSYPGQPLTAPEQKQVNDAIGTLDETAAVAAPGKFSTATCW